MLSNALPRVRTVLLAASAVAVFGFGASQALASPEAADRAVRACTDSTCNTKCRQLGEAGGWCNTWTCECF